MSKDTITAVLADDHPLIREGIRNALIPLHHLEFVGEASNGHELIDTLEASHPQLLLIDVTMPDFEPLSTIRNIRSSYPDMKILVISAYDDDIYVQGLLRAGVQGYLLKDDAPNDLVFAVERVLAGEKWISSQLVDKLVSYSESSPVVISLTSRQKDVLLLLHQGLDNQSIAQNLELSIKTVENHLTSLYRELNVQSRLEAVTYLTHHPELLEHLQQATQQGRSMVNSKQVSEVSVLVVDDNTRYRCQLKRMMKKVCPHAVIYEAVNIKEALTLVSEVNPTMILVDVVLADESGINLTRRIKSLEPSARVILISAYPDREFRRNGMEAGAVAFLDKRDLDETVLQQVIDDMVM